MSATDHHNSSLHQVLIAPAPPKNGQHAALAGDASFGSDTTMPYTCLTCVRRKVKCDKLAPKCSTCQRAKLDCEYQAPPPRKRKRREVDDIHDRLAKYEHVLKEHGLLDDASVSPSMDYKRSPTGNVTDQPSAHSDVVSPLTEDEAAHSARLAKLHKDGRLLSYRGKSRYVHSTLWRNLGDDVLESSDEESENEGHVVNGVTSSNEELNAMAANMISPTATHTCLLDLHPSFPTAMFLWKAYVEYVEPLIKILHVPTTVKIVQNAATNPSGVSKATECLLFAIYFFAVSVLSEEEFAKHVQEPRATVLLRYRNAASQAFTNASILRTSNITVLQAYLIYLIGLRTSCDPQSFWILTGVAIRLGQRIGIHRDGDDLALSPFETQMRRRVFWQLFPLDGMAAQSCGVGISLQADSWTTKQPLNLNDEDIWPDMTDAPTPRVGASDMIFCLCRAEVGKFFQRAAPSLGNWSKTWEVRDGVTTEDMMKWIDDLENILQDKYIRYCDIFQPTHGITNAMVRIGMNVGRFRVLISPQANGSRDDARVSEAVALAIKVLDYTIQTITTPNLDHFQWHLKAFFQWDCLAYLLNELVRTPSSVNPDVIWPKIERLYTLYPDLLTQKRTLNIAVARLVIRAWQINPSMTLVPSGTDPSIITFLRETFARKDGTPAQASLKSFDSSNTFDQTANQVNDDGVFKGAFVTPAPTTSSAMTNTTDVNFLENFSTDGMDWEFWDRLIRDPYAFARDQ